MRRLFGRSLKLRQVSAGGCNACEADLNVLGTLVFDLGRFGIQFVASPRHADGLLVTGPVTENMRTALLDSYAAVPATEIGHRFGRLRHRRRSVPRHCRGATTASATSCRSTCIFPAARRIPIPPSTGCCACWAGSSPLPAGRSRQFAPEP